MTKETIETVNELAEQFGIAIDWTSENVMPYLQDLINRYITVGIWTNTLVLVIAIAVCVIYIMIAKKKIEEGSCYDFEIICIGVGVVILCGLIVSICVAGLVEYICIPEIKFARSIGDILQGGYR